ncbi:MAG: SIR2 family protein, partial [Peptoniphilus sp.]|nr:SIR2 family protein [Peptoniphilus sp.]
EIDLMVEKESDLVNLAQYYSNTKQRSSIDDLIKENFSKLNKPTKNHYLLAQLPISTYWTTNYDKLIEKALEGNDKNPFVKTKDEQLRGTNRNFDAIVYKMHGDADSPEDAVITRSDYEEFGYNKRKLFREVLEGDLLTKTFLFLGFSFSDPNFNYVIGRLRVLLEESKTRKHYCIMKRVSDKEDDFKYKKAKQELQIEDLNRYGVFTYLVDEYSEITDVLQTIVDRYRRKTIFISGSADYYGDFSDEEGKLFLHTLSMRLSEKGYHIVNGYGRGVGEYLLSGVAEYCLKNGKNISNYLTVMPFPQSNISHIDIEKLYLENRKQMIEKCGIAIFVFGNKNGEIANGVMEEFSISKDKNLVCLPIEYTGGAAKEIFESLSSNNNSEAVNIANERLEGDISSTVENIIEAVNLLNKEDN